MEDRIEKQRSLVARLRAEGDLEHSRSASTLLSIMIDAMGRLRQLQEGAETATLVSKLFDLRTHARNEDAPQHARVVNCPECGLGLTCMANDGIQYDVNEWAARCHYQHLDSPSLCQLKARPKRLS